MSGDAQDAAPKRKPPPPPPKRTTLGERISTRPPPPDEDAAREVPYDELLSQLAAAEAEEYADPEMVIKGKPLHVRASWRAKKAAGEALERSRDKAVETAVVQSERAKEALKRGSEVGRETIRTSVPVVRSWLWRKRREIAITGLSVAGLLVAADLARAFAPGAFHVVRAESQVVVERLVHIGASTRAFAENLGIADARPVAEPAPPRPPPPLDRHALWVTTVPDGATVSIGDARLKSPGMLELGALTEPIEVHIRKWGYAPVTRTLEHDAFVAKDFWWRHTLEVTLERPAPPKRTAPQATAPAPGAPAPGAPAPAAATEAEPSLPPSREALVDLAPARTEPLPDRPTREALPDAPAAGKPSATTPAAPF